MNPDNRTIIAWWSAGVTSAVATKLAIEEYGVDNVTPIYFKIDSAHTDNARFLEQCEEWYGKKIKVLQSDKAKDQFDVIKKYRYVNGPAGARCTAILKKELRQKVEKETEYRGQVFGFEHSKREVSRAIRFKEQYPKALPLFPLISNKMTKPECLYYLESEGIRRPEMYTLGYSNNNCIGCVKGGKGYWNKIRKDFPDHFEKMATLERDLNRTCITGVFLDELDVNAGYKSKIVIPDCGNFCDIEFTDIKHPKTDQVYRTPEQLSLF